VIRIKSRIWQVHAHQDWVKAVLIKLVVQEKASVCQLWCDGMDLGKWNRAQVDTFLGTEDNQELLSKARDRVIKKSCTFPNLFLLLDIRKDCSEKLKTHEHKFDHVVCFQGLDPIFDSLDTIRTVFRNISFLLKEGGYFFGILMDSSAIWSSVQKSLIDAKSKPHIESKYFQLQFQTSDFQHIGCPYTFMVDGKTYNHYLIHFPTFTKIAE